VAINNSQSLHMVTITLDMRAGAGGHYNVSDGGGAGVGPFSASLSFSQDYSCENEFPKTRILVLKLQQGSN